MATKMFETDYKAQDAVHQDMKRDVTFTVQHYNIGIFN